MGSKVTEGEFELWLVSYAAPDTHALMARQGSPLGAHEEYLRRLGAQGHVVAAGDLDPPQDGVVGIAVFTGPEADTRERVLADPAVGGDLAVTVTRWHPTIGHNLMPRSGDTGEARIVSTIARLFGGVVDRDAAAYFDRTYADGVVIHEAPSLPYGGDHHGIAGAARHAAGFGATWDRLQSAGHRDLRHRTVATSTEAFVVWTLTAQVGTDELKEFPALSHYRFDDGLIVESRMYLFDTAAVLAFLRDAQSADVGGERAHPPEAGRGV